MSKIDKESIKDNIKKDAEKVKKVSSANNATEKMVKIHMIFVLSVCIAFGALNIITGNVFLGILIAIAGAACTGVVFFLLSGTTTTFRGTILSIAQLILIIVMSVAKHEMQTLFPLMLASMNIAAIYYDKRCLILHTAIMDAAVVIGLFSISFFYGEADIESIIKGIIGINVGAALVFYLVMCSVKYLSDSERSHSETGNLLIRVREQMYRSENLAKQQRKVVIDIASISEDVNNSANLMLQIADKLNEAAEEQSVTIKQIANDIAEISEETEDEYSEAQSASSAAAQSTNLIHDGNKQMKNMLSAMNEITESSHSIEGIIKTIEDIAFQTNILALNAAVEAARAGEAGKGFAVVADEVRTLANKSAEAVQNTSELIQASITSVEKGTALANSVAEMLDEVKETIEKSERHAKLITKLTDKQTQSIESVKAQIDQITLAIEDTSQTSVESAELARTVSEEAARMDEAIKDFKED